MNAFVGFIFLKVYTLMVRNEVENITVERVTALLSATVHLHCASSLVPPKFHRVSWTGPVWRRLYKNDFLGQVKFSRISATFRMGLFMIPKIAITATFRMGIRVAHRMNKCYIQDGN